MSENFDLWAIPFFGPILLYSGIERTSRMKYVELLKKEKLDSAEVWKVDDISRHLRDMGIPIGDVLRLVAAFKSLYVEHFDTTVGSSPPTLPLPTGKEYHVFVSHAWGADQKNHRHVRMLAKELERIGLSVWLDEERLSGDIRRRIATDSEHSLVYLACIS